MKRPEGMPFDEYKIKLAETNKRVKKHLKGKVSYGGKVMKAK